VGRYALPVIANPEQFKHWNELSGPRWVRFQDRLDAELAELTAVTMDRAGIAPGAAVLDVGCGCGGTTLELGKRVGARGTVLGLDLSKPMLARAKERVAEARLANVSFRHGDAQVESLPPAAFDLLFSRFGVMFFADPGAAFANLRRALRPGARLAFVCWQAFAENPWLMVPLGAVAKIVPLPPPQAPDAPGPAAFANPERVGRVLGAGGFADVALEDVRIPLALGGGTLEGAVELALEIGPGATALREANAGPELRARVADAIREALAPFAASGRVQIPSAVWVVTARNPG
jgi:SAM-dependent methyltransferase